MVHESLFICHSVGFLNTSRYLSFPALLLRPGRGAEYCDQPVCLCVCLCVCLSASISLEPLDHIHEILCAAPLWPWLGPPPAALRHVLYFRFYGWRFTFCRNEPYGDSGVAMSGHSLMSNASDALYYRKHRLQKSRNHSNTSPPIVLNLPRIFSTRVWNFGIQTARFAH